MKRSNPYTGNEENVELVTRGRLNKMCKYFKGKHVKISFEYNNSMGHSWTRTENIIYDAFDIHEVGVSGCMEYTVSFKNNGVEVFLQEFEGHSESIFTGLGSIRWLNSGPYCYFNICKSNKIESIINIIRNGVQNGIKILT